MQFGNQVLEVPKTREEEVFDLTDIPSNHDAEE